MLDPPCRHFDYTREGGRASQRATDFVRRRLWRKSAVSSEASMADHSTGAELSDDALQTAKAMADRLISPTTAMFGARSASSCCELVPHRSSPWKAASLAELDACLAGYGSKQRQSGGRVLCAYLWACLLGASSDISSGMWCLGILAHGQSQSRTITSLCKLESASLSMIACS